MHHRSVWGGPGFHVRDLASKLTPRVVILSIIPETGDKSTHQRLAVLVLLPSTLPSLSEQGQAGPSSTTCHVWKNSTVHIALSTHIDSSYMNTGRLVAYVVLESCGWR